MPTYKFGNMWSVYEETDAFCITTNSFIKKSGAVVMGRGIAKTARDRFEGLDRRLGEKIQNKCGDLGSYGLVTSSNKIVAFQVKTHFKEKADLSLIAKSSLLLRQIANRNSGKRFDLNYPGIGNGGLKISKVKPAVEVLPENVHVWRFENQK
jgi:hypothetical protein